MFKNEPDKNNQSSRFYLKIFLVVLFLKLIAIAVFSSDYQNKLFIPFIEHFLSNFDNPWQYFYQIQADKFPYPPLMLYILSFFYLPFYFLSGNNSILQNIFFKLPVLFSDILIAYVFIKMFPKKIKEVLIFYFVSPIIFYASYMYSQLDLVPTAILIVSVYFLTSSRPFLSSLFLGLALSSKSHLILVLPLFLIFVFRNYKKKYILYFLIVPAVVYFIVSFPYLFSKGFFCMVLQNPKQMMVFDSVYPMGDLKIYIPVFAALAVYARFSAYHKINNDLFYTFISILFSAFVLLVFPVYSWYVWMVPFLSIFFIEYYSKRPKILYLYTALNIVYLIFFLFFYVAEYRGLSFLGAPWDFGIPDDRLKNITFTAFEVILCAIIYTLFKFGVRSNSVYKKVHNLIIGIGGDSAAGKNTLLSDIKLLAGKKLLQVEGDADHKWARGDENWDKFTHLNPKANYLYKQANDLLALKFGGTILRRDYDHVTGKFVQERQIKAREFIVLTGLHPFYLPISRKVIDFKIYLDTDEDLRRHWKIARDGQERGYSKNKILEQIEKRLNDAKKYIHPQKGFADLIISYFSDDFTKKKFEIGNNEIEPQLKLKVTLNSSIHLEDLYKRLLNEKIDLYWDYADDLNSQYLVLNIPPGKEAIENVAREIIPNIEELVTANALWLDGYRGFVQLIFLLVLSEKMKEEGSFNEN
ncbi:MAG: uridine kinase [Candidatus Omnitrophica bacterium]|nr:uridine kinase [Candidatus Omnitrophota bacterium]